MKKPQIKLFIGAVLFCLYAFSAQAQKLPKVQKNSVYAPADIKTDGKPMEWGKFQAYNRATQVYYTMANDDANLYLAMQAKYSDVINRIMGGGVVLSIQQSTDKDDKNKISITYPIYDTPNTPGLTFNLGHHSVRLINAETGVVTQTTIDTSAKEINITMNMRNHLISQRLKWIGVKGVKGIDTLISIYNGDGIKAVSLIDKNEVYTLEMAVPLKYLNLSGDNRSKFTYHLQINGIRGINGGFGNIVGSPEVVQKIMQQPAFIEGVSRRTAITDFWGEYKLADKH